MDISIVELLNHGSQAVVTVGVIGTVGYLRQVKRSIQLNGFKVDAMDHALEQNFKNGYANTRDSHLEKSLRDNKFIKGGP